MTTRHQIDMKRLLSDRSTAIDVSGIRRVFELGAQLEDPVNLSIGQPDFAVPEAMKDAAIQAIRDDRNGYSLTQGLPEVLRAIEQHLAGDVGWDMNSDDIGLMMTSGTSGGLLLAFLTLLNPGDEAIIGDPYFVIYPAHATIAGARAVICDTYPDFRMTAQRVEPLITDRTKLVLINSPGNPSGVVLSQQELHDLADLCDRHRIILISDEIYDVFTYSNARENGRCPSPARVSDRLLLIRGFGKSYACTGWRLGYAAGPAALIREMMKLQQYSFVCAPTPAQVAAAHAFDIDMSAQVAIYEKRRDKVVQSLSDVTHVTAPGGAFYAFIEVPPQMGLTGTEFAERAIEQNLLVIPGAVFSRRDTHVRLSFAAADTTLDRGLEIIRSMMQQ